MPTQNVNLSQRQAHFIKRRIHDGQYRSASEVVRAGLRLLEHQEAQERLKLKALRRIAKEAFAEIDQGRFEVVGPGELDAFLSRLDERAHRRRARAQGVRKAS